MPKTEGCDGEQIVCAIYALGDGVHPDISLEPSEDPKVEDVLFKNP